jgi:hypothetical protein
MEVHICSQYLSTDGRDGEQLVGFLSKTCLKDTLTKIDIRITDARVG